MTHEHTANEEASHGNREALERMTRERDRLRGALLDIWDGEPEWPDDPAKELAWCRERARAALEDTK